MIIRLLLKYYFLSSLIILFISCNAPRNNPLDPDNPDNKIVTIDGYIKSVKVPQLPIRNTNILWTNEGIITESNAEGYFEIGNIEQRDGWIIVEKGNYSSDSVFVTFGAQKKITKNFFLNSIPKINDLQFFSITVNKFPNNQKYNLEVRANITDDENDIDSVFIENIELNTNKELLYNASSKYYENSISLADLHNISIEIVIGKEFQINVFDADAKKFVISKPNIKRIIKEEIETTSPSGRDTVYSANPLLEWTRFTPGFEYRYLVEIKTDEREPEIVWQREINSSEIQYFTDANLSSGDYFWVIWAIDEFENRTRSKESSFIVK